MLHFVLSKFIFSCLCVVQIARARSVQNIKKYFKKKETAARKLDADLQRGEQELMFDSLYKMGEANEW